MYGRLKSSFDNNYCLRTCPNRKSFLAALVLPHPLTDCVVSVCRKLICDHASAAFCKLYPFPTIAGVMGPKHDIGFSFRYYLGMLKWSSLFLKRCNSGFTAANVSAKSQKCEMKEVRKRGAELDEPSVQLPACDVVKPAAAAVRAGSVDDARRKDEEHVKYMTRRTGTGSSHSQINGKSESNRKFDLVAKFV